MGTSGSASRSQSPAEAALLHTRLGWVCVVVRDGRVIAASLPMAAKAEAAALCPAGCRFGNRDGLLRAVVGDLRRYFRGEGVDLSRYPVDLSTQPAFLRRALLAARRIPYGEVRTYGWLARAAGNPRAARAAGQAMSHNPVPLLIPCHRVVGTGGRLTGFGGGLALKRALLELEGVACGANRVASSRHDTERGRGR